MKFALWTCSFILLCFACKTDSDTPVEPEEPLTEEELQQQAADVKSYVLPSACELTSPEEIADIFDTEVKYVDMKDGNPGGKDARSCFFKWDDGSGISGSGILLQVSKNPVPDEFPDWPTKYIESKRTNGESQPGGIVTKYEKMSGLGMDGAYSTELSKYYWRGANGIVYMIALNLEISDSKAMKAVKKLGKAMTKKLEAR